MRGPLNVIQNLFEPVRATWTGSKASKNRIYHRHSQYSKELSNTRAAHVKEAATSGGKAWAEFSHGNWGALMVGISSATGTLGMYGANVGEAVGTAVKATGAVVGGAAVATAKAGRWVGGSLKKKHAPMEDLPEMGKWSGPLEGWHGPQTKVDIDPPQSKWSAKDAAVNTVVGTAEQVRDVGKMVGTAAWRTRNDPLIQLGMAGGGVMIASTTAKDAGKFTADYKNKLQMVNSSTDGGGAFLYDQAPIQGHIRARGPEFDRMGAGGDLVFALHNLRNGG